MIPIGAYREAEDDDDAANASGYRTLEGPGGFSCTLTEPEDRTWDRDLQPVVAELNRLYALHAALADEMSTAIRDAIQRHAVIPARRRT